MNGAYDNFNRGAVQINRYVVASALGAYAAPAISYYVNPLKMQCNTCCRQGRSGGNVIATVEIVPYEKVYRSLDTALWWVGTTIKARVSHIGSMPAP